MVWWNSTLSRGLTVRMLSDGWKHSRVTARLHGSIGQSGPLLIASCWWYALRRACSILLSAVTCALLFPPRLFISKPWVRSTIQSGTCSFIQHWIHPACHIVSFFSIFLLVAALPLATSGQVITSRVRFRPCLNEALCRLSTSVWTR